MPTYSTRTPDSGWSQRPTRPLARRFDASRDASGIPSRRAKIGQKPAKVELRDRAPRAATHQARDRSDTTGNSPQTNHINTISALFPGGGGISSVCGSSADAPRSRAPSNLPHALDRGTPKPAADFTSGEIVAAPARQVLRTRKGRWGMPDQDELDAMTKAWTYAVLDALEAADDKTRLEIVRILCPAGFTIVPTDMVELPKEPKN
jgi:hypothetical protein